MNITKTYDEKELTITVDERIDTVTAPDFENEIMDEMGNFDSLILDVNDLEYISSAGLRVLVLTHKKLKPEGIPFVIKNVNDTTWEIQGYALLEDISKELNIVISSEEYDTFSGFILHEFGSIPEDGTVLEINVDGLHITEAKIVNHQVESALLQIEPLNKEEEDE